jgi:hypothetical protein
VLSLLALKAIGRRRVSHVDDVCSDPAPAAFAGLQSLPKATALGSYSYRLERAHDKALLAGLARAMTKTAQSTGGDFDLDFHAIMHFGDDVALDTTTSRGARSAPKQFCRSSHTTARHATSSTPTPHARRPTKPARRGQRCRISQKTWRVGCSVGFRWFATSLDA